MSVTQDASGPYAPASAIINLIERHRQKGLPSPIVAETLGRAGISESLIPRTLQALATLDLVTEEGRPTETFEGLRLAPESEYRDRLAEWLRAAYSDALQFIEPDADEVAIRDAFRSYNPIGQQARMVTLFIGLMTEAGLREKLENKPPIRKTSAGTTISKTKKKVYQNNPRAKENGVAHQQNALTSSLPPALAGLLQSLPNDGGAWDQETRDKFLATFSAVIDFCYRVQPTSLERDEANNQESDE